jgi:uncharacterized Zn finger protein (UPF0148 family)
MKKTLICKECGLPLDEEETGRYYCPNCGKYTEFFDAGLSEEEKETSD